MIETSLSDNTTIVLTEHSISPTLVLGSLPVTMVPIEQNGHGAGIR